MKVLSNPAQRMLCLAGFVIMVCCVTSVAVLMGWLAPTLAPPANMSNLDMQAAAASTRSGMSQKSIAAAERRAKRGCPNCGVIEATRMHSDKRYETTVRFEDNTMQIYAATTPPQWQPGDRVRVVDDLIRVRSPMFAEVM